MGSIYSLNTKVVIYYRERRAGPPALAAVHHCHPCWNARKAFREARSWLDRNKEDTAVVFLKLYAFSEGIAVGAMVFTAPSALVGHTLKGLAAILGNNTIRLYLVPVKGKDFMGTPRPFYCNGRASREAWNEAKKAVKAGKRGLEEQARSV